MRRPIRKLTLLLAALAAIAAGVGVGPWIIREAWARLGRATIDSRLAELRPRAEPLWRLRAAAAGVAFPPADLSIVVLKAERRLLVYADGRPLAGFDVTAASGGPGPKLREGDLQVPEGLYRISSLNPNSRFRLGLRVDYPNDQDRAAAAAEGRETVDLGGDIMIHGGAASIGCVAIGDTAIEELFWLVATVGREHVDLVLCPDASPAQWIGARGRPDWVESRYRLLEDRLRALGTPPATAFLR